jgi:hypothetical protein
VKGAEEEEKVGSEVVSRIVFGEERKVCRALLC